MFQIRLTFHYYPALKINTVKIEVTLKPAYSSLSKRSVSIITVRHCRRIRNKKVFFFNKILIYFALHRSMVQSSCPVHFHWNGSASCLNNNASIGSPVTVPFLMQWRTMVLWWLHLCHAKFDCNGPGKVAKWKWRSVVLCVMSSLFLSSLFTISSPLLSPGNLLQDLLSADCGKISPNPANTYQLERLKVVESFESLTEKLGRPYFWVQWVCGLNYLPNEDATSVPDAALSVKHFQRVVKIIRLRVKSRLSLQEQVQSLGMIYFVQYCF